MPESFCIPDALGLIAGNGVYPETMARAARKAGVSRLVAAAFTGETKPELATLVDDCEWLRVGQLGKLIKCFTKRGITQVVMVGQIAPKNLFDLRPDIKALLLLARLKQRNAESLFGGIASELAKEGVTLLPATTFLDHLLAPQGLIAGPSPKKRLWDDAAYGFHIAKETSRLDIGQTVVVRNGTVLAVEAFEGTNETIKRGGALGRGNAVVIKVSKPGQDLRFDVPVVGPQTIETCAAAGIHAVVVEAGSTLLLEREVTEKLCHAYKISLLGYPVADS